MWCAADTPLTRAGGVLCAAESVLMCCVLQKEPQQRVIPHWMQKAIKLDDVAEKPLEECGAFLAPVVLANLQAMGVQVRVCTVYQHCALWYQDRVGR